MTQNQLKNILVNIKNFLQWQKGILDSTIVYKQ